VMTVKQPDALPISQLFSSKDSNLTVAKPIKMDMKVEEVKVGKTYNIPYINYKSNSSELTEESKFIIDEFIQYLTENPSITIAIYGHTDNVGQESANLALSTDRAFSILDYMERHGINKARLQFKGYGSSKPIAPNNTAEGKAKNRRTEFVITGK
jgi:outer membrane protein OmpA-like peptidoglycan-associated protein